MKTNTFFSKKLNLISLFGLATLVVSCGSYKNSSYYDNDGVYGETAQKQETNSGKDYENNAYYKEYFGNLNKENNDQIFTNVDDYSSNGSVTTESQTEYNSNASWGSNPSNVTVNYYGNSWGYGYWNNYWYSNWAWNGWYSPYYYSSWYGPSWGWGWNNYWYGGYYGYNPYFYGYYPYYNNYYGYPYGNHYAASGGRRDSRMTNGFSNANAGRAYSTGNRNGVSTTPRSTTTTPRTLSNPRTNTETPRGYNNPPRNYDTTPRGNATPRNNTQTAPASRPQTQPSTPRNIEVTPRTYEAPRSYESPRSSGSSSGGFGGSSSGGGRSGGGGGRR